jgi:hypothetical protein
MRAPDDGRLSEALAILNPPLADRERWANNLRSTFALLATDTDELDFERDSAGLTRYINALRELQASHASLDLTIQRFLQGMSDIELEIREAEIMLEMCSRSRGRPAHKRARFAVWWARFSLEERGIEVTTERKGKWHVLSQVLAGTDHDLRHHLTALLAEKPET